MILKNKLFELIILLYSDIKKFVNDIEKDLKFGPLNINKKQEYIKGFKENFIKENYLISGKEYEFEKFLDNEITIISTKGRDFSHITLKSKIYLTTKLEKQILSMLAKIKDLQERHSYVVKLLKKIDIKFVNETNFQKKLLFRELKIFLEKEEINILNQIDKTKFNF